MQIAQAPQTPAEIAALRISLDFLSFQQGHFEPYNPKRVARTIGEIRRRRALELQTQRAAHLIKRMCMGLVLVLAGAGVVSLL
ncbi:hypothetical protein [Aureimonas sp. AU40]|uniref:hypothetical protein n=1 Tax=Aureimonas sp. AU40 TaxID=1637747 RepID=UPI0007851426|nr:hypothetical protein [Aureimonas sp. AU40]